MRIVKEGFLDKKLIQYRFECSCCGCVFLCVENEVITREDLNKHTVYAVYKCPTVNCGNIVFGEQVKRMREKFIEPQTQSTKERSHLTGQYIRQQASV